MKAWACKLEPEILTVPPENSDAYLASATQARQKCCLWSILLHSLELRIQRGKAIFKKGTLRKGQEVLTFWGGIQCHSKRAPIVTTTFQWGTYTGLPQGTKATRKKGTYFWPSSVQIFGRASRPFLRASEAMALDGLGLIQALRLASKEKGPVKTRVSLNWIQFNKRARNKIKYE